MSGYSTPCQFTDVWSNIIYNGIELPSVENEFTLRPYKNRIMIGSESREPEIFGFDFYKSRRLGSNLQTNPEIVTIMKETCHGKAKYQNLVLRKFFWVGFNRSIDPLHNVSSMVTSLLFEKIPTG
jgi:hypothetical protein